MRLATTLALAVTTAVASGPAVAAGDLCGRGPLDILLTNDDGYQAAGIRALYQALRADGHRVTMVAPAANMSGVSASLTRSEISVVRDASDPGIIGVTATPASATLLAIGAPLAPARPDLIVSGINDGENVSAAIAFSGTVGAVIAGVRLVDPPIPGIAVSAASAEQKENAPAVDPQRRAAAMAERFVGLLASLRPWFCTGSAKDGHRLLNVNFPSADVADINGVRATDAAPHADFALQYKSVGPDRYQGSWVDKPHATANGDTDIEWLARGYITITPLDANYASSLDETLKLEALIESGKPTRSN